MMDNVEVKMQSHSNTGFEDLEFHFSQLGPAKMKMP